MTRAIFDPRMMTELGDFFPSTCTIQENTGAKNDEGETIDTWTDFAGHVDLACAHAPNGGVEVKQPDETYVISRFTTLLNDDYPTITEKMQAVVTGADAGTFDILLVQIGSTEGMTRLLTREVT